MDGDNTAKAFEQGANSAVKENEMSSGIHESVKQTVGSTGLYSESIDGLMCKRNAACCRRKDNRDRDQCVFKRWGAGIYV